jgi:hypothetical protein
VLVTHGQPKAHWLRDTTGCLCLDLDSMWTDFAASVDAFVTFLETAPNRREIALERSLRSAVTVELVHLSTISVPASGWAGPLSPVVAPTTSGASAIAWAPPKPKEG